MQAGSCKILRLEQIRMSTAGECIGLVATLTADTEYMVSSPTLWEALRHYDHSARRLAYIKQVFDLCKDNPPVPYGPPELSRMQWGDFLERLVERFGDENLCPTCGHLMDVPTWQDGEIVCLRDGCDYRLRRGGSDGDSVNDCGL